MPQQNDNLDLNIEEDKEWYDNPNTNVKLDGGDFTYEDEHNFDGGNFSYSDENLQDGGDYYYGNKPEVDIESLIFTKIKSRTSFILGDKYKDLNFTTSDKVPRNPKFPRVYVHMLESPERGANFEGNKIQALLLNFQIEVYDNKSKENAKAVANAVIQASKRLRFQVVGYPYNSNTESNYRYVIRIRRTVANNDFL